MIYRRSLINELANQAGTVFVVLFSIVMTVGLVQVLGEAAGGKIDPATVFEIAVYSSLVNLAQLLSLSFFIAVLMVLMRFWRDNEMIVWFSSGGLNLFSWIRPILVLAVPIVIVTGLLSSTISPWARSEIDRVSNEFTQRDDVNRIAPGRFIETMGGNRVFFIESVNHEGTAVGKVFVSDLAPDSESVVVADAGRIERNDHGDRYLTLAQGTRFETSLDPNALWRVLQFQSYSVRMDVRPGPGYTPTKMSNMPLSMVIATSSAAARGELFWRISWPLAALNLALLAIPLSFFNPRGGKNFGFLAAGLIFFLYLNAISIFNTRIETGSMHWLSALVLVHGSVLLLVALLFVRRTWMQRWLPQRCGDWVRKLRGGSRS